MLSKLNIKHYFIVYLFAQLLIWTLVPTLDRHCLHHDMLEGITQGLQYQLGYNKHPFLSMWIMATVYQLSMHHDWIFYLFAQCLMCIGFFYIYQLCRFFVSDSLALIATILPQGILFYNQESFNLTPDSLQIPFWSATCYYFYQALHKNSLKDWFILGTLSAACFLIKYQFIILLTPLFLFCLLSPSTRQIFKEKGFYLSLASFLLLLFPHFYWLAHHQFLSIDYALNVTKTYQPSTLPSSFELIIGTLATIGLVFILYLPFFYSPRVSLNLNKFKKQFILCLSFGPWLTTLFIALINNDNLVSRLLTPYFSFLGLFLVSFYPIELNRRNCLQFLIMLLIEISILTSIAFLPFHRSSRSDAYLPNPEIAVNIEHIWHEKYHQPLKYLAGSRYLVASILPYMHDKVTPFFSLNSMNNTWTTLDQIQRQGGVYIIDYNGQYGWDEESILFSGPSISSQVVERFPNHEILPLLKFKRVKQHPGEIWIQAIIIPPSQHYVSKT
jgi:hypothetical protein